MVQKKITKTTGKAKKTASDIVDDVITALTDKLKEWAIRDESLKKTEAEVAAAKSKIDNFDATVKAEVDKQVAIIGHSIKSKSETEARIKSLEFDGEKKLFERDNIVLREMLGAKEKEIAQLRAALEKKDSALRPR